MVVTELGFAETVRVIRNVSSVDAEPPSDDRAAEALANLRSVIICRILI